MLTSDVYRQHKVDTLACIENAMASVCSFNSLSSNSIHPELSAALDYSVFPAGKRLRPLLALFLCKDLGAETFALAQAAIAIELVHASSLIHDDLPALDNDELRRGRPTVHKKFGEATAILAGDYLLPLAFSCIARSEVGDTDKVELTKALADAYMAVCHGQVRDMLPLEKRGDLSLIHQLKTGALFSAAALFGAVGASASFASKQLAMQLGLEIGLCFQIVDDYIDRYGTAAQLGKAVGSDARNAKQTFFTSATKEEGIAHLKKSQERVYERFELLAKSFTQQPSLSYSRALFEEIINRAQV